METTVETNAQFAAHPFLSGMSPHHLEVLATAASTKQFPKGEIIFRAGEPANGFYLIEKGVVTIEGSVFEHGVRSRRRNFCHAKFWCQSIFPSVPFTD